MRTWICLSKATTQIRLPLRREPFLLAFGWFGWLVQPRKGDGVDWTKCEEHRTADKKLRCWLNGERRILKSQQKQNPSAEWSVQKTEQPTNKLLCRADAQDGILIWVILITQYQVVSWTKGEENRTTDERQECRLNGEPRIPKSRRKAMASTERNPKHAEQSTTAAQPHRIRST